MRDALRRAVGPDPRAGRRQSRSRTAVMVSGAVLSCPQHGVVADPDGTTSCPVDVLVADEHGVLEPRACGRLLSTD
jgi:hypothetical protein